MKTNAITKKAPVWLIVSGAILLIGLILFFVLGLNYSIENKNNKTISVEYDSYLTLEDELLTEAKEVCLTEIKANSLTVKEVKNSTFTNGGKLEFVFDASASDEALSAAKDGVMKALSANETLSRSSYTVSVNAYSLSAYPSYVGRTVIAGVIVLALAFAYAIIRFRFSAGVTVAILALHDVLMVLALTVIFRVPVSVSFVAAVAGALVYSLICSVISFVEIRTMRKDENLKAMAKDEALELVMAKARKTVFTLSIAMAALLVVVSAFSLISSTSALLFLIPALIGVIVSAYSSIFLLPVVYLPLQNNADKKAEEKARKYIKIEKKTEVSEPNAAEQGQN